MSSMNSISHKPAAAADPGAVKQHSPRQRQRRDTAERLLDGAFQLFLKNGYHGTSMDRISAETGISKPTIYNHFKSKDVLFAAIIKRATDSILKITHTPPRRNQSIESTLYKFSLNYAETVFAPEMISLHRLVLGEAERFPELGALYYDSGYLISERGLAEYLRYFVERGDLEIHNYDDASNDFWELVLGYLHTYLLCNPSKEIASRQIDKQIKRGIRNFLRLYGTS